MEIKIGDRTIKIPSWVMAAGVVTVGTIVSDICNVRIANHKKWFRRETWLREISAGSFLF